MDTVVEIAKKARDNTRFISNTKTEIKNKILTSIAEKLIDASPDIIAENKKDLSISKKEGI